MAILALIEERPYDEIADALHVPIGTVKSRVFRATRALREELQRLGDGGMTADESLVALLRSALPPVGATDPARDLWPLVAARRQPPVSGRWLDLGLAAVVTGALLWQPAWLVQLAYHL